MGDAFPKNLENYKPVVFPQSLRVIKGGSVDMETENLLPKILEFEARKVVELGNIGKEHVNIPEVWPSFLSRIHEIRGRKNELETIGTMIFGDLGYLACIEVDMLEDVPDGMFSFEIPKGKYVLHTHKGPLSKIGETFDKLMSWIKVNNFEESNIVTVEVYDHRFKGEAEDSEFDSYIEIKQINS
ncbi:GyrI-like domain-containing protein [Paenibacillus sp. GCM10027629]|uniref:GyrI-like domain-containing protein n=1 Tax=Paenibacillus sp. GCM10027629 TaxID=3273414 RepID=UPI00362C0352